MEEKRIVINVDEEGSVSAETIGMVGTECIDELDKLMKGLAMATKRTKKPEFYQQKTSETPKVINKHD